MGSNSSKGKNYQATAQYGQIFVQTEKNIYYAGETVSGNIYLNLASEFPGTQLFLRLKGTEQIDFTAMQRGAGGGYSYVARSQKNTFLKQISLVREWGSGAYRGQYVIPFSFLLPLGLAGSFYQTGTGFAALKVYQIEAYLQPTDTKAAKLKYKRALVIREPLLKMLQQHTLETKKEIFSLQCRCNEGTSVLKATFSKNILAAGDTVEINWEFDNSQCKSAVMGIYVYLKQSIVMKIGQNMIKPHEVAISHQKYPGVTAGAAPVKETTRITLPQFRKDLEQIIKRTWTADELKALKDDGTSMGQITTGDNLSSRFALEVLVVHNVFNIVRIECPVDLIYPELTFETVAAPANWQPQTFENYNFALSYQPSENTKLQIGNNNNMQTSVVHPLSPK